MREPLMRDATSEKVPWTQRSLVQLTLVRFREFIREPEAVFWTFVFPVLLAVGLGIAFRNKPADAVTVAVVTGTPSADSLATRLEAAKGLRVERLDDSAAARALRTGEVALVVVRADRASFGSDPGEYPSVSVPDPIGDLALEAVPPAGVVEYRFDDTRPEGRLARLLVDDAVQRGGGRTDPILATEAQVREKGSRYIDFVVPGLLGMNIMAGGIWGLGFAIVEARRRNLLKRFVSTPMSRAEYLASFLFSRFVFLLLEIVMILGCSMLFFGVPVRGGWMQLFVVCFVAALAFGGVGLLIASRARTTEGVSGLMNLAMMPMWVLSGVFFSANNFPRAAQPFIQALPLTATINALRATMLHGAGWGAVAPGLAIVSAWGIVCFVVALKIFRWR